MKVLKIALILIAVVCIGVAVSYPIRYKLEMDQNNAELEDLSSMRRRALEAMDHATAPPAGITPEPGEPTPEPQEVTPEPKEVSPEPKEVTPEPEEVTPEPEEITPEPKAVTPESETAEAVIPKGQAATGTPSPTFTPTPSPSPTPARTPDIMELIINDPPEATPTPSPTPTPSLTPSPEPTPTPDRSIRAEDVHNYASKEKVVLDEDKILPELREIYALNHDLVGWIYIPDTNVDYPVVQSADMSYYLTRDFYGNSNANGQIILDTKCDPYTPSYNLVISGHHMNSGAMFGKLYMYRDYDYWQSHKLVEFDTLMARKRYVIFAAFFSADYDVDEEGFHYNVDIQYRIDAKLWLNAIHDNQIYDTGIDVKFGDEFITLTTCDHSRRSDGRFVVVARRIREGENIQ